MTIEFITQNQLATFAGVAFRVVKNAIDRNHIKVDATLLPTKAYPSRALFKRSRVGELAKTLAALNNP
jgi:hypothetical protein